MTTTRYGDASRQGSTVYVLRDMLSSRPAAPAPTAPAEYQAAKTTVVVPSQSPPKNKATGKKRPLNQPVENIELNLSPDDWKKINETKSFHVVLKIYIEGKLHFVKLNVEDSPMSPIEAAISEVNRFLIDDLAAPSRAVYKMVDGKPVYFAVASRSLDNFKSLIDDPLKPEHLKIGYLENVSGEELKRRIEELDQTDEEFTDLGRDINKLDRGSNKKIRGRIPVDDLIKYHRLKVLTTVLELDHFMEEDDGHRGNIGNGNFDDDCKLWKITIWFKEAKTMIGDKIQAIDWYFRKPNEKTFQVTTNDLDNSPDLRDESRFIWCTKTDPYPAVVEKMRSVFKKILSLSQNAYNRDEINLFKALKDHPVYKFNKNRMYLREILPDDRIFANLLSLHMKPNLVSEKLNKSSILEAMSDELKDRQRDFREKLIPSAQFKQFLEEHGEYAMKWIEGKYDKYNKRILQKIELHKNDQNPGYSNQLLVDLKNLRAKYAELRTQVNQYVADDAPRVRRFK